MAAVEGRRPDDVVDLTDAKRLAIIGHADPGPVRDFNALAGMLGTLPSWYGPSLRVGAEWLSLVIPSPDRGR